MTTYATKQGDTWDIASYRAYGDEGNVGAMIAANPAHARTVIFSAGVELAVPEITTVSPVTNLPPWRTGV